MSSTSTLPNNDLMSPPKSGRFQLVVTAVAKSDKDADTIHQMVIAIQKRALSDEEPETLNVSASCLKEQKVETKLMLSIECTVPSASIS